MPNYIFQDLRTNAPNCKLEERLLQGSTARVFAFTLFDRAKQALLDPTAELTLTVLYEPQFVNGVLTTKGSFVMDKQNPNYNIAVRETQIDEKFSIIYAPFVEEYTAYAGNCELILQIIENGITTYTYGMSYFVDRNDAYMQKSLPNNLPTYKDLQKQIQLLADGKAAKDLTNVDLPTFKTKVIATGLGQAETAAQIKALLEKAVQSDKLDYSKALTGQPTANDYARAIESLSGASKLASSAIRDLPNPNTIAMNDLSNVSSAVLNTAIEGTNVGKQVVDNTMLLGDKASKDLSDVSDADFETKGKASNFAQNNLVDVDIFKLSEKIEITDSYQKLKSVDDINSGSIKSLENNIQDMTTTIQGKADTDLQNVDFTRAKRFDNAVNAIASNHMITPAAVKTQLEYHEEQGAVDITALQSKFLELAYQFTSENEVITQVLPSISDSRTIIVTKIDSNGISNTSLIIKAQDGELIDGGTTPITITEPGLCGVIINAGTDWRWIPYPVMHEDGLVLSDDKNNIFLGDKNIKFKKATLTKDGSDIVVTPDSSSGGGLLSFKAKDGSVFSADSLESLDKSIELIPINNSGVISAGMLINPATLPAKHNEGIHACLGSMQLLNSMFSREKLFFGDVRWNGGKFVYVDANTKSFVIQDTDPQDDPNVSGGTTFLVILYFDPSTSNASITQDGDVEIQLVDDNDVVLKTTDGLPVTALIKYKAGDIPKPELYIGEIQVAAFTRVHMKIKLNFPTEEIIYAGPNTQLCLQSINAYESSGIALLSFMLFTGYRFNFETKYYGTNSINLAKYLLFDRPQADVPVDSTINFGENLYVNFKSRGKAEITNSKLILQDNGTGLPVFSISKVYNPLDCAYIGGKGMNITVKITNKEGAFIVGMLEYTGSEKQPPIPFVTGYNNSNPIFTNGWIKKDELFIVEDPTKDEHTESKQFQLPKDAKSIAFILYPMDTVIPCKLTLGDFEGDITPWLTKTIISSNSHIKEMQIYNKDLYRFTTYTPSGFRAYRMTANMADTKLGIGKNLSVGDTLVSKPWPVIEGVDPDKVQSDLLAKKDGKGFMRYTVRAFNDSSTDNALNVFLGKKNANGTYTEVYQSRLTTTIGAHTSIPQILDSTEFALDFKANDEFRLFMKSNVDDGFYLECDTDGVPMLDVKIEVNELTALEAKFTELDLRTNEVKFVEDGVEVFNKILQYDVKTGKMTVVDKGV